MRDHAHHQIAAFTGGVTVGMVIICTTVKVEISCDPKVTKNPTLR